MDERLKKLLRDRLLTSQRVNDVMELVESDLWSEDNEKEIMGIITFALSKLERVNVSSFEYQDIVRQLKEDLQAFISEVYQDVYFEIIEPKFLRHSEQQLKLLSGMYEIEQPSDIVDKVLLTSTVGGIPISEWFQRLTDNSVQNILESSMSSFRNDEDIQYDAIKENSTKSASQFVNSSIISISESALTNFFYGSNYTEIYAAIMDYKTTKVCASLNGNEYELGKGPIPPLHINCRSQRLPKAPDEDIELPSFEEWLNSEGSDFQKAYLGPNRYKLWKSGEFTLDKFVSPDLKYYTLEQLKNIDKL